MPIIFGFRSFVTTLATLFARCGKCGNPAAQRLSVVKRKFTLFFIPVFTFKKTHVLTCAMCGTSFKISAEDAARLQAGAAAGAQHEGLAGTAPAGAPAGAPAPGGGVPAYPAPPAGPAQGVPAYPAPPAGPAQGVPAYPAPLADDSAALSAGAPPAAARGASVDGSVEPPAGPARADGSAAPQATRNDRFVL